MAVLIYAALLRCANVRAIPDRGRVATGREPKNFPILRLTCGCGVQW